jgi:hypothetical protein
MVAGFDFPDTGRIVLQGNDVTEVQANRRPVNMVFQQYARFVAGRPSKKQPTGLVKVGQCAEEGAMAIRWLLIFGAVVAVALVLTSFKKAHTGTDRLKTIVAPPRVTPAQFRRVRLGMSVRRVRRLLGTPTAHAVAGGQLCWDYGTPLSKGGMYAVCFRRGKVTYTARIG